MTFKLAKDARPGASRSIIAAPALLICAALAWSAEPSPATPAIEWRTRLDKAMDLARQDGKPVLLDFTASWCPACREMERQLWSRPDVVTLSDKFVCVKVDVDRSPELAQRYRTQALPTLIFSDPWGTEIARREGFGAADEYLTLFRAIPGDFSDLAPWQARLDASRHDPEALRQIGIAYQKLNLFQASTEFLERALKTNQVRSQPEVLAEILTLIGWNSLKMGNLESAKKSFERCLKEIPTHGSLDMTLYGLFFAHLSAGERQEAEPLLQRLDSCCPTSRLTARAHADLKLVVAQDR